MPFLLDRRPSPLGTLLIVTDERAILSALDFEEYEPRMRQLMSRYHDATRLEPRATDATIGRALDAYFAGDLDAITRLPTRPAGTPFQRQVWQALRGLAPGATTTYGALAESLGRPTASRAVGMANGQNPLAIVVPCHRVIGKRGVLTGYAGGLQRKRWLLEHEGRHAA